MSGFSPDQVAAMCRLVGIPQGSDPATIVAAVQEALDERLEPTDPTAPAVIVPSAYVARLRADAGLVDQVAREQKASACEALLAQHRGKFYPFQADTLRKAYEVEGHDAMEARLKAMPILDGMPTEELGHAGDDQVIPDDERILREMFGS